MWYQASAFLHDLFSPKLSTTSEVEPSQIASQCQSFSSHAAKDSIRQETNISKFILAWPPSGPLCLYANPEEMFVFFFYFYLSDTGLIITADSLVSSNQYTLSQPSKVHLYRLLIQCITWMSPIDLFLFFDTSWDKLPFHAHFTTSYHPSFCRTANQNLCIGKLFYSKTPHPLLPSNTYIHMYIPTYVHALYIHTYERTYYIHTMARSITIAISLWYLFLS